VLTRGERVLSHRVVSTRRRGYEHRVTIDGRQRFFQASIARGGPHVAAGFGVGVYHRGQVDTGGCCYHPGPATAPDAEPGLDYAEDGRPPSPGVSPLSSQASSSGESSTAPASTLEANSSPVLQPTRAKISGG
jgi:hypothetical protein